MIVRNSPQKRYWRAIRDMRHPTPATVGPALAAILELALRSDQVGRKARDLLANIRFGSENDPAKRRPGYIYLSVPHVAARTSRRQRLLAESEWRILQGEARIARQIELVERLSAINPTRLRPAVDLLSSMGTSLQLMQECRRNILRDVMRSA